MVKQKCIINPEKLETLISAFCTPEFDFEPQRLDIREIRRELISQGLSELEIIRIMESMDNYSDKIKSYKMMLSWGKDRREAIENYTVHFERCFNCWDVYTDILKNYVLAYFNVNGLSEDSLRLVFGNVHEIYLGHPEIRKVTHDVGLNKLFGRN